MGSCFFVNGLRYKEACYTEAATRTTASLVLIALCFLVIPTALSYSLWTSRSFGGSYHLLPLSQITAMMLLIFFIAYLFFRLYTHSRLFLFQGQRMEDYEDSPDMEDHEDSPDMEDYEDDPDMEEYEDGLSARAADTGLGPIAASVLFMVSLGGVALCAAALVSSIQGITFKGHETFIGFILFPFLSNITDYTSACIASWRYETDIVILVTLGSSMQILLFTWPSLVILGWVMGVPVSLQAKTFEAITVFVGVFVANLIVQPGKSNYLNGAMCIAL